MTDLKKHILECLDKYCDFTGLCSEDFYDQVVRPLEAANCFENWTYDSGATKGVLIFSGQNFVIKIPFVGYYNDDIVYSHYETECGEWVGSYTRDEMDTKDRENLRYCEQEGAEFEEFYGAGNGNENISSWNYCEAEEYYYKKAVEAGISELFAKTELLGYANGHPIYEQVRCNIFDSVYNSETQKGSDRTMEDYKRVTEVKSKAQLWLDDDWVFDLLNFYGEEIYFRLAAFIDTYGIRDFHNGNIGYFEGVPCLVDYSSYCN